MEENVYFNISVQAVGPTVICQNPNIAQTLVCTSYGSL